MNDGNTGASLPKDFTFLPDDFEWIGEEPEARIDSGFSSNSYWKDVRHRFLANKGAVVALVFIVVLVVLAIVGPGMTPYSYSEQVLTQKNFAPRIPGLERWGIFDGKEIMHTTTGSKTVNGYQDRNKNDVYYWFGSDTLGRDIWTRVWGRKQKAVKTYE